MPKSTGPQIADIERQYEGRASNEILRRSEVVHDEQVFRGDGFSRVGHGCDCLCSKCVKRYFGPTPVQDSEMREAAREHAGLSL